jgi:hypothetical protein
MIKIEITINARNPGVSATIIKQSAMVTNWEELVSTQCLAILKKLQYNVLAECDSCGRKGIPMVGARQTMDAENGTHLAWRTVQCPSCKTKKDVYE